MPPSPPGLAAPARFQGFVTDDPLDLYTIYADDNAVPDHIRRFRITVAAGHALPARGVTASTDAGAGDDLDLYLLCPDAGRCPNGSEVLASNEFNTADEVIDILDPAPGEYVIDVHGYDTDETAGGPGANFEVGVWTLADQRGRRPSRSVRAAGRQRRRHRQGQRSAGRTCSRARSTWAWSPTATAARDLGQTLVEVVTPTPCVRPSWRRAVGPPSHLHDVVAEAAAPGDR